MTLVDFILMSHVITSSPPPEGYGLSKAFLGDLSNGGCNINITLHAGILIVFLVKERGWLWWKMNPNHSELIKNQNFLLFLLQGRRRGQWDDVAVQFGRWAPLDTHIVHHHYHHPLHHGAQSARSVQRWVRGQLYPQWVSWAHHWWLGH